MPSIVCHCTAILACLLALRATAGVAPWYFLPNFGEDVRGVERGRVALPRDLPTEAERLLSPDGGLSPDQREQVRWHEATFPHRDFAGMMPQQKAFGWYAHAFGVPQQFAGMDLLLDLGIIDDADETFVNGVRVGGLGKVPATPRGRRTAFTTCRLRKSTVSATISPPSMYGACGGSAASSGRPCCRRRSPPRTRNGKSPSARRTRSSRMA